MITKQLDSPLREGGNVKLSFKAAFINECGTPQQSPRMKGNALNGFSSLFTIHLIMIILIHLQNVNHFYKFVFPKRGLFIWINDIQFVLWFFCLST